jgi:hypothetical protein
MQTPVAPTIDFTWALKAPCPTCKAQISQLCFNRKKPEEIYSPTFWVHASRRNLAMMMTDDLADQITGPKPDQIIALYLNGDAGTKLTPEMVIDIQACAAILGKWGTVTTS